MTDINAVAERIGVPDSSRAVATTAPTHIDADACASRLGISKRHWLRLVDRGAAPSATRFGRLVRWSIASLEAWERNGCKPVRVAGKAVRP